MATLTTSDIKLSALPPAAGHAGLRGVIASEFTKLRSVRSTYWTIAALIITSVGVSAIIAFGTASNIHNNPWNKAGTDATQLSLGFFFEVGQLIIAVIGAMIITSEYSTGMIRTSLTAMPRRGTVYLAKLIVLTSVTLVVSLVTSFVSFFVAQAALSGSGVSASLFHSVTIPANANVSPPAGGPNSPGQPTYTFVGTDVIHASTVLTAVVGTALFVTVVALIAFGLGAIIRHTAGAITSTIGLMFVLSIIIQLLPNSWRWDIMRFFPDAAGRVISVTVGGGDQHLWSSWPQFLVTVIWAVVLVGVGGYLFRKRDA
ncbi:MAG: type transporter [Actinomycetia bacterium]|jgi:ABC-2 type transport system permease protein|nr:type transporter [Actinomycetes bacterium]MDT7765586.1 type transport system permease protein [Mycobacterium sp.]